MKLKENENVCEMNFDGRFSGELCWEMVQQLHIGGAHELFGRFSNTFASEGSPILLPKLGSVFSRTTSFVLKTVILLAFGLGICEGVGEDSGHVIGHIDIRVGSCNYLNVFVLPCMCT